MPTLAVSRILRTTGAGRPHLLLILYMRSTILCISAFALSVDAFALSKLASVVRIRVPASPNMNLMDMLGGKKGFDAPVVMGTEEMMVIKQLHSGSNQSTLSIGHQPINPVDWAPTNQPCRLAVLCPCPGLLALSPL